jgi:FkbM family methyltransferase
MRSEGDEWVPNQVFWRGWQGYEPETSGLFFSLAEKAEVTIDVGAHVGFYALLAAHANTSGSVVALEPVAPTFARLCRNVALNCLVNVDCLPAAASDTAGQGLMYVPRDSVVPCSAGLSEEFYRPWAEMLTTVPVPTVTLDQVVAERGIGRVGLVKLDTEGSEPAVLRGMSRLLREHRPLVVCEVLEAAGSAHHLERILGPLGYVFDLLTPDGPVRQERIKPHPVHLNFLFRPTPLL